MKTLFASVVAAFFAVAPTDAQSVPFYGFELSNYEVGDTLEYALWTYEYPYECNGFVSYTILDKQTLNADSVLFTVQTLHSTSCFQSGVGGYQDDEADTVLRLITNDTVYGNHNNVLDKMLRVFDTTGVTLDSPYLVFDTVDGNKRLRLHLVEDLGAADAYTAIQNLGITELNHDEEDVMQSMYHYTLVYAHTEHYGVYGQWQPFFLNVDAASDRNALVVTYDERDKTIHTFTQQPNGQLRLFDVPGRCVLTADVDAKPIPTERLNQGIYFYSITGAQTASGKLWIR